MRMKNRMYFFVVAMFGGFFGGVFTMRLIFENDKSVVYFIVPWIILFLVLQFIVFRCPHCRKLAIFPPTGGAAATPFVGLECKHCRREY